MQRYLRSAHMAMAEKTNGGVIYLLPDILIKICTLVPLIYLWRVVMSAGVDAGMTVSQMVTYTYVSALLSDMMVVQSPASGWLSEGVLMRLYGRPLGVIPQLVAQTMGGWLPMLALFALPMALLAPLLGVNILPASPLFFLSLAMCVSLGFAIDCLFACLSIKLRNMNWLIGRIRMAVMSLLSGAVIPVQLMPFGIGAALKYQPFASLGGAALSVFVGSAEPVPTVLIQLAWNAVLWPVALLIFRKSQEGMVSYGG